MYRDRVRLPSLLGKAVSAAEAANLIQGGMTAGMSGLIRAGGAKAVSQTLAMRAKERPLRINLMTDASLGNDLGKQLTGASVFTRRMPSQADSTLRKATNASEAMFIDRHLSETAEQLRDHRLKLSGIAVIETVVITEQGHIVSTISVDNLASFVIFAKRIIVGINLVHNTNLEGLYDIYIPIYRPTRTPIPLTRVGNHIGSTAIPIPPEKIIAIVINDQPDSSSIVLPLDGETQAITNHLIDSFKRGVDTGYMNNSFDLLQAGIGNIANAVMCGLIKSLFESLTVYSEVLQDSISDLINADKLRFAPGSLITLSPRRDAGVFGNLERYKDKLALCPQEISNHPEVVHHLGVIGINMALELDTYDNVNSIHVGDTKITGGTGDSGNFVRNVHLMISITRSIVKDGSISSVVPMVSHVDHTEHDVDILVIEQGLADLRDLTPRRRARATIKNRIRLSYQASPLDYFETACVKDGHTLHLLRETLTWHLNLEERGHMLVDRG